MRGNVDSAGNRRGSAAPDLASGFDPEKCSNEQAKESFRIRDLSRELGVTARTLRFYEECELLSPRRDGQATQLAVASKRFRDQIDRLKVQKLAIDKAIVELERVSEIVEGRLGERPES